MNDFTIEDPTRILEINTYNKDYKNETKVTDFSVLLGAYRNSVTGDYSVWTRDSCGDSKYYNIISFCGGSGSNEWYLERTGAARPVLDYSLLGKIPQNFYGNSSKKLSQYLIEVEYGYYPQTAVDDQTRKILNSLYSKKEIQPTGNTYTADSVEAKYIGEEFKKRSIKEYEYNEKKYVRVKANFSSREETLNGVKYKDGDYVWVEVEPVKWIVNLRTKKMITKNGVFSGIQFSDKTLCAPTFQDEKLFRQTNMKKFLDKYWSIDLERHIVRNNSVKTRLEKLNPDTSEKEIRRDITDTELIHNWIENGESVLLRGPSGIGKTERIRTLYPNLIELKLTNSMFPEKVVGSTNIQTGEDIPPNYAKQIILEAATDEERKAIEENIQNIYEIADEIYRRSKESDKKIVILLDELLNVNPNVQSLVFSLVLNKFVEIGSGIKLPKNVVVVATGNSKRYSNVAEDLVKPLEKRFDHILDMQPRVGEWISEYAIPNTVHPAVIGYIISKYNMAGCNENINEMGYFYEEPEVGERNLDEYGCEGRTNDPRGWVAISNMLYNFEANLKAGKYIGKDVEDILIKTLDSKLRLEWSKEFFDFYNLPTLTPEEVVCGLDEPNGFTQEDLPVDINERFAFMTALLSANETQVEACRNFIRKYCDPEYLAIYDIYWAGNDERRMEIIAECEIMNAVSFDTKDMEYFVEDGIDSFEKLGLTYKSYLMSRDNDLVRGEGK